MLYTRDRTETTAQVWLGLTAELRRLPRPQVRSAQPEGVLLDVGVLQQHDAGRDGRQHQGHAADHLRAADRRSAALGRAGEGDRPTRKQIEARKQAARADFDKWLRDGQAPSRSTALIPSEGLRLHAGLNEGSGETVHLTVDGKPRTLTLRHRLRLGRRPVAAKAFASQAGGTRSKWPTPAISTRTRASPYGAWVKLPRRGQHRRHRRPHGRSATTTAAGTCGSQDDQVGTHIINKWPDDALKVVVEARRSSRTSGITCSSPTTAPARRPASRSTSTACRSRPTSRPTSCADTIRTKVPFKIGQRHTHGAARRTSSLQDLRLYGRTLTGPEVRASGQGDAGRLAARQAGGQAHAAEKNELFDWWLAALDTTYQELTKKLGDLQQEEVGASSRAARSPRDAGEARASRWRSSSSAANTTSGATQVKPATPEALPPMPADLPRNRLGFAQWLLRPDNPLTARVTVNRFWQEVFGTGLVRTSGDFGVAGELPSHPELLDWLAVEFRETGWDVKKFFKLLVTSATYRQSAAGDAGEAREGPATIACCRAARASAWTPR